MRISKWDVTASDGTRTLTRRYNQYFNNARRIQTCPPQMVATPSPSISPALTAAGRQHKRRFRQSPEGCCMVRVWPRTLGRYPDACTTLQRITRVAPGEGQSGIVPCVLGSSSVSSPPAEERLAITLVVPHRKQQTSCFTDNPPTKLEPAAA